MKGDVVEGKGRGECARFEHSFVDVFVQVDVK
jgi:hypothetical protein